MLQILQARSFSPYQDIINTLDIDDEIFSIAEAIDNGEVLGYAIYHFNADSVILDYCTSNGDLYLYDGLVRSVLFIAVNNGIEKAIFALEDKTNIEKLGFVQKCHNSLSDLSNFLNNCKSCKK